MPSTMVTQAQPGLPVVTGTRLVKLDYADQPITTVVTQIVGDILQLPLSIDSDVTGTMTLQATGIPISDIPARLNQALHAHGYGLAMIGGQVRVGSAETLNVAGGPDQIQTQVIPLRYVQATDVIAAIQQTAPDTARIIPDPAGRGIVVTGPRSAINAVAQLVALFDVNTLSSRSFGLYPLTNTTPGAIVGGLEAIFRTGGGQRGPRFAAIDRLNAILVVADTSDDLIRARQAIAKLDVAAETSASVHVYPLQNRRAAEVANVLARTFGETDSAPAAEPSPAGSFANLMVGSNTSTSSTLAARPPGPASPPAGQPNGSVPASAPASVSVSDTQRALDLGLSGPVRIEADRGRNALVILAAPADYQIIEQTIRRLDVKPREVFIEAAIAEVTLTDALKYGVDYAIRIGDSTLSQTAMLTSISGLGGFTYLLRSNDIDLTLQALSSLTTVKIISAPRLLVVDNGTASLQVGNQVPILTSSSQSQESPNAPVVNQVEMRDTGVILAVTPSIGSSSSISLDLFQEVSQAQSTTSSSISSPTIQLRRVQTTVSMQSGETVALGGLMQDQIDNTRAGIPILSSLPLVGPLFGTRQQSTTRTELLVLLTPRIVTGSDDLQGVTNELRGKIDSLAPDVGAALRPAPPDYSAAPSPPPSRTPRLDPWESN